MSTVAIFVAVVQPRRDRTGTQNSVKDKKRNQ